jgi:hypothetical protein
MNEEWNDEMSGQREIKDMSCREFEEALDDLDSAGTPGMTLRETALAHAEGCSHCAQLMTDSEALDFSLRQIALRDAELEAPLRVEAALLQEFRWRQAAGAQAKKHWRVAALGAAAAVLLTLGISLRHISTNRGNGGAGTLTTVNPPGLNTNAANAGASGPAVEVAQNVSTDAQDASAFVSLPYATDPATLEGGTVVRVELTRAALASMGMPVTASGSLDRIPADIMLSEDGVPQAIRLVGSASDGQ